MGNATDRIIGNSLQFKAANAAQARWAMEQSGSGKTATHVSGAETVVGKAVDGVNNSVAEIGSFVAGQLNGGSYEPAKHDAVGDLEKVRAERERERSQEHDGFGL